MEYTFDQRQSISAELNLESSLRRNVHDFKPPGTQKVVDLLKIYKELRTCTSRNDLISLRKRLEPCSESSMMEEVNVTDLFKYSDQLENLIKKMSELIAQGEFPSGLTIDAPDEVVVKLPAAEFVGQQFHFNMDEIEAYLMSTEFSIIGVQGMGGVGKTTLMMHVHNNVSEKRYIFGLVYWITVSKDCSIYKLQTNLAKMLNEDLSKEEDELKRAGILTGAFERKGKFVLFLDDVWTYFDLLKVGVQKRNGCKVIMTTRSMDVCSEMKCNKTINVDPLPKEEALHLFLKTIDHEIPPAIELIVKDVVKECAGLPLGIITLARSMRILDDIHEWRSILEKLRKSEVGITKMDKNVFSILKLSYDRLDDSKLQKCLLYCALYPEDHPIIRRDLIWLLIGKGLFGRMTSILGMVDEAHGLLNQLERSCLLSGNVYANGQKIVKMHDLVRDMVLQMTYPQFLVRVDGLLKDFPDEEEWTENLEVVSLMHNDHLNAPSMSPTCPKLSILLLQRTSLMSGLPDSFFEQISELQILNFSDTRIKFLPSSISYLKNLTTLLLGGCGRVKRLPSLANLTSLNILDLSRTSITQIPKDLEKLRSLRYLNLEAYRVKMKMIPIGMLPKLIRLEYLVLPILFSTMRASANELIKMRRLERYVGRFLEINDFNGYVRHMHKSRGRKSYELRLGGGKYDSSNLEPDRRDKVVILSNCSIRKVELPKDVLNLHLEGCNDVKGLCDIKSFSNTRFLDSCYISRCQRMEHVFSSTLSPTNFSQLRLLKLIRCSQTKEVFSQCMLPHLQNLEKIYISGCEKLERVIGASTSNRDGSEEATCTFTLPKLTSLTLIYLPELKDICTSGVVLLSTVSHDGIRIVGCPKLRKKPMLLEEASTSSSPSSFSYTEWMHL